MPAKPFALKARLNKVKNITVVCELSLKATDLREVWVCQSLFSGDSLVWINLKHLLKQVNSHMIGSLEHTVEVLLLHLR